METPGGGPAALGVPADRGGTDRESSLENQVQWVEGRADGGKRETLFRRRQHGER